MTYNVFSGTLNPTHLLTYFRNKYAYCTYVMGKIAYVLYVGSHFEFLGLWYRISLL